MNSIVIILTIAISFLAIQTNAQIKFDFLAAEQIQLSEQETKTVISSTKKPSQKGFRVSREMLNSLPHDLSTKLLKLDSKDLSLADNSEYEQFLKFFSLTSEQANAFRHEFILSAAKSIIHFLQINQTTNLRIMARDLNEVMDQIDLFLSKENKDLGLSYKDKVQILSRISLVPASRPMIDTILGGQNPRDEIMALFNLSEKIFRSGKVAILDSGYNGSIVLKLQEIFKPYMQSNKLSWNFFWKGPQAPHFIKTFELPGLEKFLLEKGLTKKFNDAGKPFSFRVALLEHFPKWTGRTISWKKEPVVIMLDLDDTVLKEIDINKYRQNSRAQLISYIPSPKTAKKYQDRLANGDHDESKLIHFEFNGELMTGAVTVRPAIEDFISDLEPLITTGKIRLLVTSNNDPTRTEAMISQLKINGKTLDEIGAEYVPNTQFNDHRNAKDMGLLRRNLGIADSATVIAIDDLPENYVRSSIKDEVEGVRAFNISYSKASLNGEVTDNDLHDKIQFNRLREAILAEAITTEVQTELGKIRAAYFLKGQENYRQSSELRTGAILCSKVMLKGGI